MSENIATAPTEKDLAWLATLDRAAMAEAGERKRFRVRATYDVIVLARDMDEARDIADGAPYDHRVESMVLLPDSVDVEFPDVRHEDYGYA